MALLPRGDFEVPDLGMQNVSFYALMSSASRSLLDAARTRRLSDDVGHFGLKMLFGE